MSDDKSQYQLTPIDKPWDKLEIMHIDQLTQQCGMYTHETELNNGYGCLSPDNTQTPGCCYEVVCPLAIQLDEEDPRWEDTLSPGEWMIVHSQYIKKVD